MSHRKWYKENCTEKTAHRKYKDETCGKPIKEFVGLRSKMYSVLLDNNSEKKTAKGIKNVKEKNLHHEDYKRVLFEGQYTIRS